MICCYKKCKGRITNWFNRIMQADGDNTDVEPHPPPTSLFADTSINRPSAANLMVESDQEERDEGNGSDITQICDNQHRLHMLDRSGTILDFVYVRTIKMPCQKKRKECSDMVPNYSDYDYAITMQEFFETDKLSEKDMHTLECYSEYEVEGSLNNFTDWSLNDHLYAMYKRKRLETAPLMRKLVSFFM